MLWQQCNLSLACARSIVFPLSVSTSFSLSAFHSLLSLPPPAGYQVRGGWECVCESARIFFLFPSLCLSFTHTHSPSLSLSLCLSPPFSLCTHAHTPHSLSCPLFLTHAGTPESEVHGCENSFTHTHPHRWKHPGQPTRSPQDVRHGKCRPGRHS